MTFTPLQWTHGSPAVALVTDADLALLYPRIAAERWQGVSSYATILAEAFNQVIRDLVAQGYARSTLIEDSAANQATVKQLVIHLGLYMIFRTMVAESGDVWDVRKKDHHAEYVRQLTGVSLDYDNDESGTTDESEASLISRVEFVR